MSEKKQIVEEMARHIPARIFVYDVSENTENLDEQHREIVALHLYRAGYRKQSEGVWELGRSGCMYYCSECKYAAHPREVDEWSHCPRCGAKMKGV